MSIIRVHYPVDSIPLGGRITVRTDADWELSLAADSNSGEGNTHEFLIGSPARPPETEGAAGTWFYFKPVIEGIEGSPIWSQGENVLASGAPGEEIDVYPAFFAPKICSHCELKTAMSDEAGVEHRYRVFYPPGYHENTLKRYPVLYMHDGQNLFFRDEAFLGNSWDTEETYRVLEAMNAIEEVIVVGIYPNDRMREYTSPGYEAYGRFIVETLIPRIDRDYRTLTGPENTAAMGSSLGGVVSFYLGWQWSGVFGKVGCLSSTFGYRDDLMRRVLDEPKRKTKIYIDSGWPQDNYEATVAMRESLIERGYEEGTEFMHFAFPNARHNETFWAARSHIPLQYLFRRDSVRPAAGALPAASRKPSRRPGSRSPSA